MRLTARAKIRSLTRALRTPKGLLMFLFILGFFGFSLAPTVVVGIMAPSRNPEAVRSMAGLVMLGFLLISLMSSRNENGIAFLPAEVAFLFPGPFTRRQLLIYKLSGVVLASLGLSTLLSIFLLSSVSYWIAGYSGIFLALLFIQLVQIALPLLSATVTKRAYSLGRKLILVALAGGVAVGLASMIPTFLTDGLPASVADFRATRIGFLLLAPFDVFARTITAESIFPELVGWGSLALATDLALVLFLLFLDADFLEASLRASKKRYEQLQRVRSGKFWSAQKPARTRMKLPLPPRLGGLGPIAWRQMVTALRSSGSLLVMLVFISIAVGGPMLLIRGKLAFSAPMIAPLAMMVLFVFPQFIRFDFRADVDRMESLKTLPLRPTAIVIGQLVTPVIMTMLILCVLGAVLFVVAQSVSPMLLYAAFFTLPVSVLIFEVENLVFLIYPHRPPAGGALDVQAFGRNMLVVWLKMLILLVTAGTSTAVGAVAYFLSGGSWTVCLCAAWLASAVFCAALVPALTTAFKRFDPSIDTPG
jgi:hypothetical protein